MNRKHWMTVASRYIPTDSTPLEHPEGLGIVYLYASTHRGGKPAAVAYRGKSSKSEFHTYYSSCAARTVAIDNFFESLEQHKQRVIDHRKSEYEPHTFTVGDIIQNTWGYDQTNLDFYEIVRTSEHYVWLRELRQSTRETGYMTGRGVPLSGLYASEEIIKHRASKDRVSMKYGSGSRWDYSPVSYSSYA